MKKIIQLFLLLFSSAVLLAQAPEKINYQAVARDLSGNPLINQTLSVEFEIRQGSGSGSVVYAETHAGITTNQFGLFTAEIGNGFPSAGPFSAINWGANLHYLVVIVNGISMGNSQLLSVPYALYAKESQNGPQGLPGRNSLSIVTAEPIGSLNCSNGGNKIEVGTDDNGNSTLDPFEIDFTYYVCNGDSGATGIGINWMGNGITFPPTPNATNDAFYHSVHNTSYIYNGTSWDTLVSGNVGSAGFWSQSGNTIYNNNIFGAGNVSIGTSLSFSKLTVLSPDSLVASFIGSDPNVAGITITNTTSTGTTGILFLNGINNTSSLSYSPSIKTLSLINEVTDGHIYINSDSTIVSQTKVIANQAEVIGNQALNSIYNNTDTIYDYSPTGSIVHVNQGLFLTDSLYVLGNNFLNPNWILANNGLGQARWTDPNSLGLGGGLWQSNTPNIYFNTGKVGIGTTTPSAKLHVGGGTRFGVADTASVFFQSGGGGNGAARDWKIYVPMPNGNLAFRDMGFDNLNNGMSRDAMVIQFGTGNVGIGMKNPNFLFHVQDSTATPTTTLAHIGSNLGIPLFEVQNSGNIGIGTSAAASKVTIATVAGTEIEFVGGNNANIVSGSELRLNAFSNTTVAANNQVHLETANIDRLVVLNNGNIGIGTNLPLAKLHIEENTSAVMMLKEVTPTSGAAFVMESMNQYVLLSNESGTFRIENNTNLSQPFNINPTSQVGIGGDAFYSALDVYGRITMRNGATSGYVPVSDANGTMTWTDPNTILNVSPSPWTLNGTNIHPTTLTNNVGIGIATPMASLHIARDSNSVLFNQVAANTPNLESGIIMARSRGTILAPSAIQSNDEIGLIGFMGHDGTGFASPNAGLLAIATENFSTSGQGTALLFSTTANGTNNGTARMMINHNGNIGIGTNTPSATLDVNGSFKLGNQGNINSKYITGAENFSSLSILPSGITQTTTVVPGAASGDFVVVTLNTNLSGVLISSAFIDNSGNLIINFLNTSGTLMTSTVKVSYIIFR